VRHSLLILVVGTIPAIARQSEPEDTLSHWSVPEVIVTATRERIPAADSPSPYELLGASDIRTANGTTVADLTRDAAGVFLQDYGASGALKSISLRGLGSEQTLVLVNGLRINSFQNGLVDLGLFPLASVDKVELVQGGNSALYGSDAEGGVLNILTRAATGPGVNVQAGGGSYGYRSYLVEGSEGNAGYGIVAGFGYESGRDNYPFESHRPNSPDTSISRDNADFRKHQLYITGNLAADDLTRIVLSSLYVYEDRGVPGPVSYPSPLAREQDDDVTTTASLTRTLAGAAELSLSAGMTYSLEHYSDPDFESFDSYKNDYFSVNPELRVPLGEEQRFLLGVEFSEGSLESNDFEGEPRRIERAGYLSDHLLLERDAGMFDRLSLFGSVRYDDISDVGNAWNPRLGFNLRLVPVGDLRLRGSWGSSFRAPTFNDMYYPGFSNPSLKPERSSTFDAGITAGGEWGGFHSIELGIFDQRTENRIVLDPQSYIPFNIGIAHADGLQGRYEGYFLSDRIRLKANVNLVDARKKNKSSPTDSTYDKRLVYAPSQEANLGLTVVEGFISFSVRYSFVGNRPATEDNSVLLPAFRTIDFNVVAEQGIGPFRTTIKAEVENALSEDYEILPDYPMPERTIRLSIGISR